MARVTVSPVAWLSVGGRRIDSVESAVAEGTDMGLPVGEIVIVDERRATGRRRALQKNGHRIAPAAIASAYAVSISVRVTAI